MSASQPYTPQQVLPHRAPMLLIDRIVEWHPDWIDTEAGQIDSALFDDGRGHKSSMICLEYLCQSAAAHAGITQLEEGRKVQIGFIIGARSVEIDDAAFHRTALFRIHIDLVYKDERGIGVYHSSLYNRQSSGQRIAFALIKAVMPDDPLQVIKKIR